MNIFVEHSEIIEEIVGYTPTSLQLNIAWEQFIAILGYNPIKQARIEYGEVGDSGIIYPKARPVIEVNLLELQGQINDNYRLNDTYIDIFDNHDNCWNKFPFDPYHLAKYKLDYVAGYDLEEIPYTFYLVAGILLDLNTTEKELKSYSIDTITEVYADNSQVNKIYSMLAPYRV